MTGIVTSHSNFLDRINQEKNLPHAGLGVGPIQPRLDLSSAQLAILQARLGLSSLSFGSLGNNLDRH